MKAPSKFVKVKCSKCNNQQVVFSKSASHTNCLVCDALLVKATGGESKILGEVLEVLE